MLSSHQEELLLKLVEAWNATPREQRGDFRVFHYDGNQGSPMILFPSGGDSVRAWIGDLEVLSERGFLRPSYADGDMVAFRPTEAAFQFGADDVDDPLGQLLVEIVEAERSVARDQRQPFVLVGTAMSHHLRVSHPGMPNDHPGIYPADIEAMAARGWIAVNKRSVLRTFDVMPDGIAAYESLMRARGRGPTRIERSAHGYIDSASFRAHHPSAFAKWQAAEELLWQAASDRDYSAVGHYCREAAQEFATSLLARFPADDAPAAIEKTKARVAAIVRAHRHSSDRVAAANDALVNLWFAVIDIGQRQEHGSQKQYDPLTWEDGRRLVFTTLLAMTEIARALEGTRRRVSDDER